MKEQKYVPLRLPFHGGIDEIHERASIPHGSFSRIRNMRWRYPGLEKRLGQSRNHTTTAHTGEEIISGFGFSKGKTTELSLFAQYENGSVDKATDNPPTATTGNFGTSVLAARSGAYPATYAPFRDHLLYADGAGQAQIYTGQAQKPLLVNVYKGSAAIPDIPEDGADYTSEATDDNTATVVELDSLDTLANFDACFMGFETPVNKITFTVSAANGNASTATLSYRKNDSTWASASATDGTASGGASIAQTGSLTWTLPTDEIPHYAFGKSCFIYRITFSAALDAEVEVSAITGENTAGFQSVQNLWDGAMVPAVEVVTLDTSATAYYHYASTSIKMTDFTWAGGANDYLYFRSLDKVFAFFLNVGKYPNTTASSSINEMATWTGAGWTALTGLNDGTAGGANSGFVSWARNNSIRKTKFKGIKPSYWYRVRFSTNVAGASSMIWSIQTLPYFDINTDYYKNCQTVTSWDGRAFYSFNDEWIYGTASNSPMCLNGDDLVMIRTGNKARNNKILCARPFYNVLAIWNEEKGAEGGFLGLLQPGATAAGYDYQLVSNTGILNSKCAVVLEGANMEDLNKDVPIMSGLFWVSRNGVFKSNGAFVTEVTGGIANYFDPSNAECIRRGYEKGHFFEWDEAEKVMILGLVSGSSATKPNKFFVYSPFANTWIEDTRGQAISCISNVEAASGNTPVLQMAGGQDGFIYRFNSGSNDISTAIDGDVIMELDAGQDRLVIKQELLKSKVQSVGNIARTVSVNGNTTYDHNRTISMVARVAGETYRREEKLTDHIEADHLSVRWQNNEADESMYLLDVEYRLQGKLNR